MKEQTINRLKKAVKTTIDGHKTHLLAPANDKINIEIPGIQLKTFGLTIYGTSILVCHAFSEKARREIIEKQMGIPKQAKEKREPLEDFKRSLMPLQNSEGFGFKAECFKKAAVEIANHVELKKTDMRKSFFVLPDNGETELIKIQAPPLQAPLTEWDKLYWNEIKHEAQFGASMREDAVRNYGGVADLRYRAQFPKWHINLRIRYNSAVVTEAQLVNLFQGAGFGCGIGEYRPQRGGSWGTFSTEKS